MRADIGLPQVALVERRRPVEELVQALLAPAEALLLGRGLLVLELHVEAVGEELDRADEVDALALLDEGDRVAPLAAAEALERAALGRDAEARGSLLVERAETDVASAGLPQTRVALD